MSYYLGAIYRNDAPFFEFASFKSDVSKLKSKWCNVIRHGFETTPIGEFYNVYGLNKLRSVQMIDWMDFGLSLKLRDNSDVVKIDRMFHMKSCPVMIFKRAINEFSSDGTDISKSLKIAFHLMKMIFYLEFNGVFFPIVCKDFTACKRFIANPEADKELLNKSLVPNFEPYPFRFDGTCLYELDRQKKYTKPSHFLPEAVSKKIVFANQCGIDKFLMVPFEEAYDVCKSSFSSALTVKMKPEYYVELTKKIRSFCPLVNIWNNGMEVPYVPDED